MNEITFEEELAQLEALRGKHQMNAEEIMDWEEKVYDLQQEIRERDAESLDQLSDSVIDALENRYQAMLDGEIDRLEQSREAWQTWRDDSVRAVEDQIAALDQLATAQDREKQDAEELRKIEKLRQQIAYEQDDYNRAKLRQQLDQALESREERLARLELEDQKEALRAQIEQIEQAAESELTALDREQEAVEAAYAERMEEAALRAEAEKLILSQSQDELLSLLEQYAPDYDALGQTLGEKLLDGFARGAGDVAAWFEDFSARLAGAQARDGRAGPVGGGYLLRRPPDGAGRAGPGHPGGDGEPDRRVQPAGGDPGAGGAADGGGQRGAGPYAVRGSFERMGVMIRRWLSNRPPLADHKPLPYLPPSSQHERKVPLSMQQLTYINLRGERAVFGRGAPYLLRSVRGVGACDNALTLTEDGARDGGRLLSLRREAREITAVIQILGATRQGLYESREALCRVLSPDLAADGESRARLVYENDRGRVVDVGGAAGRAGLDGARGGRAHGGERAFPVREPVFLWQRGAGGGVPADAGGVPAAGAGFR